ncbi:transposase [Rhizobium altiplani]|uniref:transposase n=1 Tax=Rhizobium altiplani TaxID=1864509 RepID=UPI003CCA5E26
MNRLIFEAWMKPNSLRPCRRAISSSSTMWLHKSERAAQLIKQRGAWLLFLPAYSPDLNPIEMAFSKLKTLLKKRAARSFDAITKASGEFVGLFSIDECLNFFRAAGYEAE